MKKYNVIFTQHHTYTVEADNEDDAVAVAEDLFDGEMRYPVANTLYDEVEVCEIGNGWVAKVGDDNEC